MLPIIIHSIQVIYTFSLEISGNAFMGNPWKDINLQVHFRLEVLVLYHINKLNLCIVGIDS
jgi:hypothetical protein